MEYYLKSVFSSELMVHDLSLAPCADFKILATGHKQRFHVRMKNSTRWLALVRELAAAGHSAGRSLVATVGPPSSCEISLAKNSSTSALRERSRNAL